MCRGLAIGYNIKSDKFICPGLQSHTETLGDHEDNCVKLEAIIDESSECGYYIELDEQYMVSGKIDATIYNTFKKYLTKTGINKLLADKIEAWRKKNDKKLLRWLLFCRSYARGKNIDNHCQEGETIYNNFQTGETINNNFQTGEYISNISQKGENIDNNSQKGETINNHCQEGKTIDNRSQKGETIYNRSQKGKTIDNNRQEGETINNNRQRGETLNNLYQEGKAIYNISQTSKTIYNISQKGENIDNSYQEGKTICITGAIITGNDAITKIISDAGNDLTLSRLIEYVAKNADSILSKI